MPYKNRSIHQTRWACGMVALLMLLASRPACAQPPDSTAYRWYVGLPLRWTHLQGSGTLLSGVSAGRVLSPRWRAGVSVYHSFYLASLRPRASLPHFDTKPSLFINVAGATLSYKCVMGRQGSVDLQGLVGWGALKYDLDAHGFSSRARHYVVLEPAVAYDHRLTTTTALSIGLSYRALMSRSALMYASDLGSGAIPLSSSFPHGLTLVVTLTGFLR